MALTPFFRALLQAGHIRFAVSSAEGLGPLNVDVEVLNLTGMSDLSESGCGEVSDEAGQNGCSLTLFATFEVVEDGVSDGTQKEGRDGFADCRD